jgi:hypothetical protein
MRTTVMIDDDVYATIKEMAQNSGRTFGEVLSRLARRGLSAAPAFDVKDGVPIFRVSPGAEKIPGDRASGLLDAEP